MRKILRPTAAWLFVALLWLSSFATAWASHIQGGQISYRYVGPGAAGTDRYSVTVAYFGDCTGISLPTGALALVARRGAGCTGTTVVNAMLAPVGMPQVGTPYCGSVQATATCTGSSASTLPLYRYQNFTGTVDLPPAPEWTLSVEDSARPSTANLTVQGNFRFEAKLYSLLVPATGGPGVAIRNNSPQYSSNDLPVPFVPVNQPYSLSFAASETEGDSLVYSLEAPLETCGANNAYKNIPGTCAPAAPVPGCTFVCPTTGIAGQQVPGRPFSATMPIAVGYNNTACVAGQFGITPKLQFTAETGLLQFTPNLLVNSIASLGDNKYVVVCKISEYRRIASAVSPTNRRGFVLVGSVRRDFLVTIVNGMGNLTPNAPVVNIDSTTIGGLDQSTPQRTIIQVRSCNFSTARINFTDPDNITTPTHPAVNPLQLLTVSYIGATPLSTLLQGGDLGTAVVTGNGTPTPALLLSFQPGPALIGQTITLTYRIDDDACPIKGTQIRSIEIKVVDGRTVQTFAGATSTGLNNSSQALPPVTICPGGAVDLKGYISSAAVDSVRRVVNGRIRTVAQTYDLIWFAPGGRGLPLPTPANPRPNTKSNIGKYDPTTAATAAATSFSTTVRPLVTTRYSFFANPRAGGFPTDNAGRNVCGDSISVLVRVVPEPVIKIIASDTVICRDTPVMLQGQALRPTVGGVMDNIVDTFTYQWRDSTGTTLSTASSLTITPPAKVGGRVRYQFTATGDPRFGCDATKFVYIRVVPNATPSFTTDSTGTATPGNTSSRLVPPVTFNFTNTSTLSDNIRPFAADTVRFTVQRVRNSNGTPVSPAEPEMTLAKGAAALGTVTKTLEVPGYYLVRLYTATTTATTQCARKVAAKTIVVPDFFIPNIITPNGDGLNDYFLIKGNLLGSKLEIYNRWGRKVEDFGSYQNQWKADGQSDGVYYYYLTEPSGVKSKGWIEVVR